jgi:tagatose 1,6-diphosphate aldolase GatY/KbaY
MGIVSAKQMLLAATKDRYSVGAFNVTSVVQLKAVIEAAEARSAPLILQTSVAPVKLFGVKLWVAACRALAEKASIPICLHLDHCTDAVLCKAAADAGYTNIMIDASKEEFETNVRITKDVVDYCHQLGDVTVEGELGTVCGVEDQIKVTEDEAALCDPDQAEEFVRRTGIDLFAPAIGTAHGVYRTKNPRLHFDRLQKVFEIFNAGQPTVPLVIHGGTGLQNDVVKRLVAAGGCKFNVSTELKHTLINATYEYVNGHRDEYNPGRVDAAVCQATIQAVSRWIDVLGCAGKA